MNRFFAWVLAAIKQNGRRATSPRRRGPLGVESMEDRVVPSAAPLSGLSAPEPGHTIVSYGHKGWAPGSGHNGDTGNNPQPTAPGGHKHFNTPPHTPVKNVITVYVGRSEGQTGPAHKFDFGLAPSKLNSLVTTASAQPNNTQVAGGLENLVIDLGKGNTGATSSQGSQSAPIPKIGHIHTKPH
jgi:hypothetical protein